MHPRLVLDLPRPGMSRKRIFERVFDQSNSIPPRKKARRESSKAVDDSAERAAEEKLMLLGDTKHDKDFQPRFICPFICLIIGFNSLCTRKNGRRRRQKRIKLLKLRMGTNHVISLAWSTLPMPPTRPGPSQRRLRLIQYKDRK